MMKKSVAFLALLAAACSSGAPTPDQQRITALEQEKALLEAQLKESRDNVAKLHAALGRSGSNEEVAADEPAGPVEPQPANPQPDAAVAGSGQKIE